MSFDCTQRRVVITGMGVISPCGQDLVRFWENVRGGVSAAAPVGRFDASKMPVKIGAEVKDFDIARFTSSKKFAHYALTVQFGVAAAMLAIRDAGIEIAKLDPDRTSVVEGTTISGAVSVINLRDSYHLGKHNYRALHPYDVVGGYCGEGSSTIGLFLGIHGNVVTYCSGCASGNDAIGYAAHLIRSDDADVAVAGGSEEMIELMHMSFCRVRAMTELDGDPARAMRPFDKSRDGFVLGEGSAFLILEELSHARGRGARIYAELAGHGRSCEAYHPTDPHPDGLGYRRALERALHQARLHPTEVDYINAHGSATPLNDPIETASIKRVFQDHSRRLAISATKPVTGHLMGASGAIETVIAALTLAHQEIPPTINLEDPDEACDLDYVRGAARSYPVRVALNLNAGFGGRYACLVLKRI
ncbi:MAG TPA: beta-ketoacyl-[acyl-carrier-protein] synthase family protein [Candidatus Acidoferrum sp.]|nr:beta-ketoacyl-[acyl-carrier-protein] synthase family protein [Candidatus Acidoferrum sp.]